MKSSVAKEMYDVIIIGAGMTGLFIAYCLSRKKVKTLVLEKEAEVGFGVSKGHAAVIHVIQLPFNSLKSLLARKGNKMYDKVCGDLGVQLRRLPAIIVATDLFHYITLPFVYLYLKYNIGKQFPVKLILRRKILRGVEPNISSNIRGGILVEGYAVVDAFDLIYSLYKFSKDNGVDFIFDMEVDGIELKKDCVIVNAGKKSYIGKFVVNAAGLYADNIASYVGDKISFEYGMGAMIIYKEPVSQTILAPISLRPDPKTKGGGIIPSIDGKSIWGPNLRMTMSKDDSSVLEEDINVLVSKFHSLLYKAPKEIIKVYSGVRPIPIEDDFIIDYSNKSKRIVHVAGIESPGLTASPAIAEKVCQLLEASGIKLIDKSNIKYDKIIYVKDMLSSQNYALDYNDYIICPCSMVSRNDVKKAVLNGARTLQGLMFRTYLGFDECQLSSGVWRAVKALAEELGVSPDKIVLRGRGSWLVKKY